MCFAGFREIQSCANILLDVFENFFVSASRPKHGSKHAVHTLVFTFDTHASGRRIKGNTMSKPTQNVKHHVNVVDRQLATMFGITRFFGEHVKVEPNTIPCEDCETALRFAG